MHHLVNPPLPPLFQLSLLLLKDFCGAPPLRTIALLLEGFFCPSALLGSWSIFANGPCLFPAIAYRNLKGNSEE